MKLNSVKLFGDVSAALYVLTSGGKKVLVLSENEIQCVENCFSKFKHCHKFSHCALLIGLSTVITLRIKIYSPPVGLINSAVSISQL